MSPRPGPPNRDDIVVAIDGPAGSGKSTVARGVARALGLRRLDTGAMYRALTAAALSRGIDPNDGRSLASLARQVRFEQPGARLLVDGRAPGRAIRSPEVSRAVSAVAAHPGVRKELVRSQRQIIDDGGIVVEGRDIGTVVCADADVKVFLTASSAERARRRHKELAAAGVRVGYRSLKGELDKRDALDSNRKASPLRPAADAHLIDSTGKTPAQVVRSIVRLARDAAAEPKREGSRGGGRRA